MFLFPIVEFVIQSLRENNYPASIGTSLCEKLVLFNLLFTKKPYFPKSTLVADE